MAASASGAAALRNVISHASPNGGPGEVRAVRIFLQGSQKFSGAPCLKVCSSRRNLSMTASSENGSASRSSSSVETVVDVTELLKSVANESQNFVFVDDEAEGESDSRDGDPFAPRGGIPASDAGEPQVSTVEAAKQQVLPTAEDIGKVLSAYHEAAPSLEEMSVVELQQALSSSSPPLLLDVRSEEEFEEMHVPEAINLPLQTVVQRVRDGEVNLDGRQVAIICRSGVRSARAASELSSSLGLTGLVNVTGGTLAWAAQQFPLERKA